MDATARSNGPPGGPRGPAGGAPALEAPAITLPKGGGAIRGIGEKFAASPVRGTGSLTVPIATSAGRSGVGPQLALTYDSGAGNGPFGFGWTLSIPEIGRKTDKGVPLYRDEAESDVFILSGAEDLVPVLEADGTRWEADDIDPAYIVHRYRPRVEGLFARIERWTRRSDGDMHWRSISRDNVLTLYGNDANSRIADPLDPTRIFRWLICEVRDDKGNAVLYEYKHEDGVGVDLTRAHERNRGDRDDPRRKTNRYLKRIHYGNRAPLLDSTGRRPRTLSNAQIAAADWMFEVVFDYGDHDVRAPTPEDTGEWTYRVDPFSSYRSGFEVRTHRLCQRVLVFHSFENAPDVGNDCLVRSTDFMYSSERVPGTARNPLYTFLLQVSQNGHRRQGEGYRERSLPPLEFEYSEPVVDGTVRDVDEESLENLPTGVDDNTYRWVDLHGEGIPGILTEQSSAWFYKRNLSPVSNRAVEFGPTVLVAEKPNVAVSSGAARFMDLAGDGQPDLAVLGGPTPGLYEHDERAETWGAFKAFTSRLNRDFGDPNLRFVDVDGDGRPDVLISEDETFVWHASLGEEGFGPAQSFSQAVDEEEGPRLVFADGTQSIYLADLSGDGLTDLVRIRNGECCYWPHLGRRYGAKVTMDQAPHFDNPDEFEQHRLRLADIDGTGTTDLIYLHRDGVRLYFNQSGNSWSAAHELAVVPTGDVAAVDLLGNGTACLVWSSALRGDTRSRMRYVDLMGQKPHLLVRSANNLGAETRVSYASSTKFFLADERDGKPWLTRLPFPVHVVERVETFDHISRNHFVTRYAYHHGAFDGQEREFCGFGMVEQWDTEQIGAFTAGGPYPQGDNIADASHVPPVRTKSWFHTGVQVRREVVSRQLEHEYFREPGLTIEGARPLLLEDSDVPSGLTLGEEREACRALRGSMLRHEVYGEDAGPGATADEIQRARTPYTVTEQNFGVRVVQPRGANRHGVCFPHAREAITFHYERNPADPRVEHSLTLEVDAYGNVVKDAAVGYGRRRTIRVANAQGGPQHVPNPGLSNLLVGDRDKQSTALLTYTENRVTNAVDASDAHRIPLPCETRTFELTGYAPTGPVGRFRAGDLVEPDPDAVGSRRHKFTDEVPYEGAATGNPCRRPLSCLRKLYRRDDLTGLLPLGELHALGLPGETYKVALTPGVLAQVFRRPRDGQAPEALLPDPPAVLEGQAGDRGGYLRTQILKADGRFPPHDADDHFWLPSGQSFFTAKPADPAATELEQARKHFFLPRRYRDPFGEDAFVDFDADDLLMVESRDALGNRVTVEANDYRVLQPRLVSDPNRNQTAVAFDALGMVVGTAALGKPPPGPVEGDSLTGFVADPTQAELDAFFAAPDPHAGAQAALRSASTRVLYDLDRFRRTQQANPADPTTWQPPCAATLARETHVNAPRPPGGLKIQLSFSYSDGFGREVQRKLQAEPGAVLGTDVDPRWIGSGWTVFNNKGKPVRQFEPFFSATHAFEFGVRVGVSPVVFYDAGERVVATLYPNHTFEKVVFDSWRQTTYDVNDTCAPRNAQTGDPRTDPDVRGYTARYFADLPASAPEPAWQSWHAQRIGGALGPHEQAAATRAAAHADTPAVAHLDALGRPFLTEVGNRVVCAGHDLDGTEDAGLTRVELDIEGHQRAVRDAVQQAGDPLGRIVVRYAYDMVGNTIHQLGMEAGARWMLSDAAGNPIRAWDSRGHDFVTTYDALRRPVEQRVRGTTTESDPRTLNRDILVDKVEFGESLANAEALNLRTRIYRHFDSAGVATNARLDGGGRPLEAYDFKGNLLHRTRRLVSDYTAIPDWLLSPSLDAETLEGSTRFDALNRPVQTVAPHSSLAGGSRNVIQPVFNEANLLERIDVWLERPAAPASLLDPAVEAASPVGVANIDYDAKGRRTRIDYRNGASTVYAYDPLTFRLSHVYTRRGAAFTADCDNAYPPPPVMSAPENPPQGTACGLQNLRYTYDPAGNVTHIQDDAQQTIYFRNARVEPSNDYTYDALYRLIQATGREHLGQANGVPRPSTAPDAFDAFHTRLDHPNEHDAMGTYIERYVYDAAGNVLRMRHRGGDAPHPGWTRVFDYAETSLIEDGSGGALLKTGNRLTRTTLSANGANPLIEPYEYDAHGNMVRMPHLGSGLPLPNMHWDYKDRLRQVDRGGGGTAYYVYDASGQRLRKVWEKSAGLTEERISFGDWEIFRRHGGAIGASTPALERETLHVMDDEQRVALVEMRMRGDDPAPARLIRYQLASHLGSATLELDDQSRIISYEEYAPYGSSTYQAVRSRTECAKRYRYTGKERDEESGLYYHGARHYAAWISTWTSVDPVGLEGGLNPYVYSRNNPVAYIDPDGHNPEKFAEGKAWEKEIMGKLKQKMALVEQVKVTAKIGNKTVVSVLDGLGKTADGWVVIESKLSDPTLREAQEQIRKHLMSGGAVTVAASTREKLADLQKTLGISTKTPIATKTYDIVMQGNASQILAKYKAIPEGFGTVLHRTGEIEYLNPDQKKLFEKAMLEHPGKDTKQLMAQVRRVEQEAAEKATKEVAERGTRKLVKDVGESTAKKLGKRGAKLAGGSVPGGSFAISCATDADCTSVSGFLYAASGEVGIGPVDLQLLIDVAVWLLPEDDPNYVSPIDRERSRIRDENFIQEEIRQGADPIYIQELEQNRPYY
jgi:RHS repeat-associated protein